MIPIDACRRAPRIASRPSSAALLAGIVSFLLLAPEAEARRPVRCGTAAVAHWLSDVAESERTGFAARRARAVDLERVAVSEHFAAFYSVASAQDSIIGHDVRLPGDDVPEAIRIALDVLERSWRLYVDTLGMAAPLSSRTAMASGKTVPQGKYAVEFLDLGSYYRSLFPGKNLGNVAFFGLTFPKSDGASSLLVQNDMRRLSANGYETESGQSVTRDMNALWRQYLEATIVHELFHSVQFRYDRNIDNFFFEASATGMEERAAPRVNDYLVYLADLLERPRSGAPLQPLTHFDAGDMGDETPYSQALFSYHLMERYGGPIMRRVWELRASEGGEIAGTLQKALAPAGIALSGAFAEYALRLAGGGRRTGWTQPLLPPFPDASEFPALAIERHAAAGEWIRDTLPPLTFKTYALGTATARGDTLAEVVYGDTALHVYRMDSLGAGARLGLRPYGAYALPGDSARAPHWVAVNTSTGRSLEVVLRLGAAPEALSASQGDAFAYDDGEVSVSGRAAVDARPRVVAGLDLWLPPAEDAFFSGLRADRGHVVLSLADASGRLVLHDAVVEIRSFPLSGGAGVMAASGGAWTKVPTSVQGGTARVSVPVLDLTRPVAFAFTAGGTPEPVVRSARPNPVRRTDGAVCFPVEGVAEGSELLIHGEDGQLVAWIRPARLPGSVDTKVCWDVRSRGGERVRAGVYSYRWRGTGGTTRGRLLIEGP